MGHLVILLAKYCPPPLNKKPARSGFFVVYVVRQIQPLKWRRLLHLSELISLDGSVFVRLRLPAP